MTTRLFISECHRLQKIQRTPMLRPSKNLRYRLPSSRDHSTGVVFGAELLNITLLVLLLHSISHAFLFHAFIAHIARRRMPRPGVAVASAFEDNPIKRRRHCPLGSLELPAKSPDRANNIVCAGAELLTSVESDLLERRVGERERGRRRGREGRERIKEIGDTQWLTED